MSPPLLEVLRLGAYQLLRMGSVPPYAAVSQAVAQAREVEGRGAGGLANAVLRALGRRGEDPVLFPSLHEDPAGHLSTWGSHPRWLVERWLERWEPDEVRRLVESDNRVPPLSLRPVDIPVAEAVARLTAAGIEAREAGGGSKCVLLEDGADPARVLEVVPGLVQDPAASLVVEYGAVPDGSRVADLCAAPGGKGLALAGRASYLLAADPSAARLRLLRENARRLGLAPGIVVARAERPPLREADVVLLDVPCSGTGTLRRHPDARWRLRPDDISSLARLQREMLDGGARLVPPGGLLLYSTCTLEPEENEARVKDFLDRHPRFHMEDAGSLPEWTDAEGRLSVLPQRSGFDGSFAARMRRAR